jgi:D-alanyl-D-alanine endopeptidase (penicillin-binding protein 7)
MVSYIKRRRSRFLGVVICLALASPAAALAKKDSPQLTAKAVLVLETSTGKALLARNASEVRPIASLTKLMAALVVRRRGIELDRGTVINREDWKVALEGCRTRLELNWTYSNRDLLHAALMSSDNRAVSALGRAVKLHANGLVQAMNEQARRLGLKKTEFRGPVGIDPKNVSTPWEMARIVRAASKDKTLSEIMGKREHMIKPMRGYLKHYYRNTNPLVQKTKGVKFLATKTGYNSKADYCLAAVAEFKGRGVVTIVILGSKSKYARARDLRRIIHWVKGGARKKSS